MLTEVQLSVAVGGIHVAVPEQLPFIDVVTSEGQFWKTGASVSFNTTLNVQLVLPLMLVAVAVTGVVPNVKSEPEFGE
jgi:hypothetical protein